MTGSFSLTSSGLGLRSFLLDRRSVPFPTGMTAMSAGETWYFQAWYRDSVGGQAAPNFTSGVEVTLQ